MGGVLVEEYCGMPREQSEVLANGLHTYCLVYHVQTCHPQANEQGAIFNSTRALCCSTAFILVNAP